MEKIKNVLFKMEIDGKGVVNYDFNEQKNYHKNFKTVHSKHNLLNNNINFAKKNFYYNNDDKVYKYDDGNTKLVKGVDFKLKISSDCIKKTMFSDEMISNTPKIAYDDYVLMSYIATPYNILTGYTILREGESLKKSSALKIVDGIQTNDAISYLEGFSKSGYRDPKEEQNKSADNLFYKETVDYITYETYGNIDIESLQFMGCDQIFDRYSFNPDNYELFKKCASLNIENFDSNLGYYLKNGTISKIPEYGVRLSDNTVIEIVKYGIKKLLGFNIWRRNANAKTLSLKIKLVNNPLTDTLNSEDNWIEIKTEQDVDNLNFDIFDFYSLSENIDMVEELREKLEEKHKENQRKKQPKKSKKDEEVSNN